VALDALVGVVGLGAFQHLAQHDHVLQSVAHPGIGRQPVAPGAPGFLVIGLDALRQVEVRDEAHVRLVDAHAEGDGGDHDDAFLVEEARLVRGAHAGVEARVVGQGVEALGLEPGGDLVDALARQAVHDAGVAAVLGADEAQQPLARAAVALADAIADVGAVEAAHEHARSVELQARDDLAARGLVGRGGERDARHLGKPFVQHG
jgi:hypothetical protein